jgi:hypothetical protein
MRNVFLKNYAAKTSIKIGKGISRLYVPMDAKIREWFGIQGTTLLVMAAVTPL